MTRVNDDQLTELGDMFRMLSDPTRLGIVLSCMDAPLSVSEIASQVNATSSLVSHHLRLLRATRLVRGAREGRRVMYVVSDDHVRTMLQNMVEHIHEEQGDHHE
ncbi:ArsR family transcriptional regulator [Natronocella acetinitrilica]|uniref:ArsR family transcriptional regulator n=1 Tax=Natronocella acetinitrilica TaxID=414046 RepID=A0AAE3G346_9GAMM|nr:metalloregulator ArsR/SmtB family transcription factor [Natronocella acetinitrilica]MCP1673543.1 ArsR family transcriptional regulator [Natronocella acetinitrilica]